MVHQSFNIFCIMLLTSKINAVVNNETVQATLLVADTTNQTEVPLKTNEPAKIENQTIEMHRITQPIGESLSPTQPIGRTLIPIATTNISKGEAKITDFRPSPQLDSYYEYNRFPVVPALPEAKQFGGINLNEKPIRSETLPWLERPITNYPATTQQPWYNKINFPTTQNPFLTVRDQPYPYLYTGNYPETTTKSQFPYGVTGPYQDTTIRNQYPFGMNYETTTKGSSFGNLPGFSKFGGFPMGSSAGPGGTQPSFGNKFGGFDKGGAGLFDKGSLFGGGKGSLFGGSKGGLGGGIGSVQKTNFEGSQSMSALGGSKGSPWKKIIKFLTAFIPIGLLLSALTPTVINVAPMNATQGRGRGRAQEENPNLAAEKLISSLNYINKLNSAGCEERVICELLMGAGSSVNAEKHVEHLLEAFTEQERDVIDQIDELKKIFDAVKSGQCNSLICEKIQENSDDNAQ